jgi:sn-glycerol 3-phosphate transport system ATP-binding protein
MATITLTRVRKSFGTTEVIHSVDCSIADGELLVVVGPSGCGKSTLLRMIAGLERVSVGEIRIAGKVVNDLEPAERDIAMVFQSYALYPHMTAFDNLAYGLRVRGLKKAEIQGRVARVADMLGLGAAELARKPRQLSGGQRQRVAMGRAIVREPVAFLFDEPLSNLDAALRAEMRLEIKKLQAGLGVTSVYVTHDQVEAMTLGHRLMVLKAGEVEQIATPLDIYQNPATAFVAGFIGSPAMNFVEARVGRYGASLEISGGETLALAGERFAAEVGRPVTLGLRPEHLRVATPERSAFSLTVAMVEALGADTLVHGVFGDGRSQATVRVPGISKVAPGDRLPLTVAPDHMHLFDPTSGARLVEDEPGRS